MTVIVIAIVITELFILFLLTLLVDTMPDNHNTNASLNRKTTPPIFKEGMSYKSWKNKIDMWQLATSVKKEEQAIVVLLESLDCNAKAEKAVSELTANELNTNEGMNLLITKLDNVFLSETIDEAYNTYSKIINYKRNDDENITDYVIEYEHLYKRMTDFD